MRHIELFFKYFKLNIKGLKSYGTDFYIGILTMILKNLANIVMLLFIYTIVPTVEGWSFYELLYLYSISTMGFALWRCLFMNTLNVAYYVRNGILDRFLIKPLNPLFQIFMEGFDDDAWGDLVLGVALNILCIIHLSLSWTTLPISIGVAFFGSLIFASFSILGSILSLHTVGVSDFSDFPYIVYDFIKYPITMYGSLLATVFTYFFPIAWISFIPSKLLMMNNVGSLLLALGSVGFVSLVIFSLSFLLWNKYLQYYTSTGT